MAELDITKTHDPIESGSWHMRMVKIQGLGVLLEIMTPENCIVGEWTLRVYSRSVAGLKEKKELVFENTTDITILMNPWNKSNSN